MTNWLRRLRGAVGIGTLWGATGLVVGKVAGLVVSVFTGLPLVDTVLSIGIGAGGMGFLLGTAFAGVLTTLERRRHAEEITPRRAAGWGALAGAGVALLVGVAVVTLSLSPLTGQGLLLVIASAAASYGALTAGLAAGTLALARRAPAELHGPSEHLALPPNASSRERS